LADCEGSYTYHLRVELDEGGIQSAFCTCPYDYAGYCKHIVALLLTYIHNRLSSPSAKVWRPCLKMWISRPVGDACQLADLHLNFTTGLRHPCHPQPWSPSN